MDLTQRDLSPAVPFILLLRVLEEAKNMQQVKRATRWFLKVGEEGFRFRYSNQFLEFMRRAMELRRASGTSWEGWDVWRAREDHTLVAQGSKIRLEQSVGQAPRCGQQEMAGERKQQMNREQK